MRGIENGSTMAELVYRKMREEGNGVWHSFKMALLYGLWHAGKLPKRK